MHDSLDPNSRHRKQHRPSCGPNAKVLLAYSDVATLPVTQEPDRPNKHLSTIWN